MNKLNLTEEGLKKERKKETERDKSDGAGGLDGAE